MTDNSLGRLVGALVSPSSTFKNIGERPTWVVALLVLVLSAGFLGFVVHEKTDYREVTTRTLEARGQLDSIPEEQLEQGVEFQERFGAIFAPVRALILGGVYCLIAVFFWVAFRLTGSELTYKQSLATFVHGELPFVLFALLAAFTLWGRGDLPYLELAAGDFLASHLGVFTPEGSGVVLRSFLTGIDFFAVWSVALMTIGYRTVARVSTTTAGTVAVGIWLLRLGFRVGLTWLGTGGAG